MKESSRRQLLRMLAGMGGSCLLAPSHRGLLSLSDSPKSVGASPSWFEQVLPSSSGITWKHVSGRSSASSLPETTGAGCAFIDYDNHGWMDISLINSGRCDFYDPSPPLRNALYSNNRDGSFTDVTQETWCF